MKELKLVLWLLRERHPVIQIVIATMNFVQMIAIHVIMEIVDVIVDNVNQMINAVILMKVIQVVQIL